MEDMAKDDNHVDIFSNNDDNNGDDNADADADKKEKNLDDEGVKNQDNNNNPTISMTNEPITNEDEDRDWDDNHVDVFSNDDKDDEDEKDNDEKNESNKTNDETKKKGGT